MVDPFMDSALWSAFINYPGADGVVVSYSLWALSKSLREDIGSIPVLRLPFCLPHPFLACSAMRARWPTQPTTPRSVVCLQCRAQLAGREKTMGHPSIEQQRLPVPATFLPPSVYDLLTSLRDEEGPALLQQPRCRGRCMSAAARRCSRPDEASRRRQGGRTQVAAVVMAVR